MALNLTIPNEAKYSLEQETIVHSFSKKVMELVNTQCTIVDENKIRRLAPNRTDEMVAAIKKELALLLDTSPLYFKIRVRLDRLPGAIVVEMTALPPDMTSSNLEVF